jgi:hypothetical protein
MEQIAREWSTKFDDLGNNTYRMDVPLKLTDGSYRYQFVFGREAKDSRGNDVYYFTSRIGVANPGVNFYMMLKEAGLGVYSMITIVNDTDAGGNAREVLLVQASPLKMYTQDYNLVKFIISEVGEMADFLEQKYFGGDTF